MHLQAGGSWASQRMGRLWGVQFPRRFADYAYAYTTSVIFGVQKAYPGSLSISDLHNVADAPVLWGLVQ